MNLQRIYSIHILLASIIFINGCGLKVNETSSPIFSANSALKEVKDISAAERSIAASICLAYKSKSASFKTSDYLGTLFKFRNDKYACGIMESSNTTPTVLTMSSSGIFSLVGGNTDFNGFIQTNTSGYLSQVCSKIDSGAAISNTTTINGVTVQIIFFKDGLEGYSIQYFTKLTNGTYQMTSAETYKTRTQLTYTFGKIMGMDEYYSQTTICNLDPKKNNLYEQTFIGRQ